MNAHLERFNRTLPASFVDFHEDRLFTDLALFHQKLTNRLAFYTTQQPHYAPGQLSP